MDGPTGRVLVVGDPETLDMIRGLSMRDDCKIDGCRGEVEVLRRLRRGEYDVIVTSRVTSLEEDLAFLEEARKARPGVRAIVVVPSVDRREIIEAIRSHVFALFTADFDPTELAEMIHRAIQETEWKDGIQMVSELPNWLSLRVTCRLVSAERLIRFMEEMDAGVKEEERRGLLAAFRELLLNAMEHGAGFGPRRGRFRRSQRPGGFGILIAQRVADEMYYNEAGNEVLLIKHTS